MNKKYDLLILFSGGYDSTLLVQLAMNMDANILCLLFDYGQKHIIELEYAKEFCLKRNIPYEIIKLSLPIASNLTDEKKTYEGVNIHHVPARNLMFLSIAASIAESKEILTIWYGANYEDREKLFPDCYQEWIFKLNELLEINGSLKITVEAPLLGMSKETIKTLAKVFNINDDKVFSGYEKE